jgi:hypothetical protein
VCFWIAHGKPSSWREGIKRFPGARGIFFKNAREIFYKKAGFFKECAGFFTGDARLRIF